MTSEELVKFPDDFLLGVGSSSFQIEGGWDQDGKGESIWDNFFHTKKITVSNPSENDASSEKKHCVFHRGIDINDQDSTRDALLINGDIACDSYNKLDEDISNLVELGVSVYRFSISWSRVLPNADDQSPNEAGVEYYKTLIQKLLDNNITPMVTLYHWDLPNVLEEVGGWLNPKIIQYFVNYANFIFATFGSQVKLWCTINEPRFVAVAYGSDSMAPIMNEQLNGIAEYTVIRNELLSHAAVYRLYKQRYFEEQQGEISLCFDTAAYYPLNPDQEEDRLAVTKSFDSSIAVFTQPLLTGEYPRSLLDSIAKTDEHENITFKRIFEFSEEEKKDLIGAYDFISFNYYNSNKVRLMTKTEYDDEKQLLNKDLGVVSVLNADNMEDTFAGFTQVIDWFVENCNNPKLFVAENGINEKPNTDESEKKIKYHRGILTELDKALKKGVPIKGYCVWSFMDSLEWSKGYFQTLYGLFFVDFNDPKRPRTKKPSFEFFQTLFKTKTLPPVESN